VPGHPTITVDAANFGKTVFRYKMESETKKREKNKVTSN